MIVNHWPAWFRNLYGGQWPTTYCAFDLETDGYSKDKNHILQIGHCLVRDCTVVDKGGFYINWELDPNANAYSIADNIRRINSQMTERTGHGFPVTMELLRAEGLEPKTVFKFYCDFFSKLVENGVPLVGHRIGAFDLPFIAKCMERFGFGFPSVGANGFLDTACLEKATEIGPMTATLPKTGDSLQSYFHRVEYLRMGGVRSNLGEHCFAKYGFEKRGVRKDQMHGAVDDSYCVHLLMEAYRERITGDLPAEVKPEPAKLPKKLPACNSDFDDEPAQPRSAAPTRKGGPRRYRGQRQV